MCLEFHTLHYKVNHNSYCHSLPYNSSLIIKMSSACKLSTHLPKFNSHAGVNSVAITLPSFSGQVPLLTVLTLTFWCLGPCEDSPLPMLVDCRINHHYVCRQLTSPVSQSRSTMTSSWLDVENCEMTFTKFLVQTHFTVPLNSLKPVYKDKALQQIKKILPYTLRSEVDIILIFQSVVITSMMKAKFISWRFIG